MFILLGNEFGHFDEEAIYPPIEGSIYKKIAVLTNCEGENYTKWVWTLEVDVEDYFSVHRGLTEAYDTISCIVAYGMMVWIIPGLMPISLEEVSEEDRMEESYGGGSDLGKGSDSQDWTVAEDLHCEIKGKKFHPGKAPYRNRKDDDQNDDGQFRIMD